MKKMFMFILLMGFCFGIFAIDVEVEQVLDAPPSKFGTFYGDSAVYASNGELLFMGSLTLNLFVRVDAQWVQLTDKYRTEEYNHVQEEDKYHGVNSLYNSTISNEFVYSIQQRPLLAEYYRVYVNESGELQAEWVDKGYFDSHNLKYLSGVWTIKSGPSLQKGYRIKFTKLTNTGEGQLYSPEIVDVKGQSVYHFTDGFKQGFVEDMNTVTANYELNRVAMVITFHPKKDSPYYVASRPQLKKLVIFKINYDEGDRAGETDSPVTEETPLPDKTGDIQSNTDDSKTVLAVSTPEKLAETVNGDKIPNVSGARSKVEVILFVLIPVAVVVALWLFIRKRKAP